MVKNIRLDTHIAFPVDKLKNCFLNLVTIDKESYLFIAFSIWSEIIFTYLEKEKKRNVSDSIKIRKFKFRNIYKIIKF